jgi:hypothetical protein
MNAECARKLAASNSLFAAAHEVHGLQPQFQRRVAVLKDRADLDGERLPASVAFVETDPAFRRFAPMSDATMRADATVWPNSGFDPFIGGRLIMKPWVKDRAGHGRCPQRSQIADADQGATVSQMLRGYVVPHPVAGCGTTEMKLALSRSNGARRGY